MRARSERSCKWLRFVSGVRRYFALTRPREVAWSARICLVARPLLPSEQCDGGHWKCAPEFGVQHKLGSRVRAQCALGKQSWNLLRHGGASVSVVTNHRGARP